MFKSADADCVDAMKSLISSGANVNAEITNDGKYLTALHRAANKGYLKAASLLVEKGANVNALDYLERTPLDLAIKYSGNSSVVRLLESKGSKQNAPDAESE